MKQYKILLLGSIFAFVVAAGILLFVIRVPACSLAENILEAGCTSAIVAIPNILIGLHRKRNKAIDEIDELIATIVDALGKNFPILVYGNISLKEIKKYETSLEKTILSLLRVLHDEYILEHESERDFIYTSFKFFDALHDLERHISEKQKFLICAEALRVQKNAMLESIKMMQNCICSNETSSQISAES